MADKLLQLQLEDIPIGTPLPWPIYDSHGTFLVKKGFVLESETQVQRLLLHGAFGSQAELEAAKSVSEPTTEEKPMDFSPFALISEMTIKLDALLRNAQNSGDFSEQIISIVHSVQRACHRDSHAALASLFLLKHDSYPIKHSMDVAVLCDLLGKSKGLSIEQRQSIIAAALTMNMAMLSLQESLYHQKTPLTDEQKQAIYNHPKESFKLLVKAKVTDQLWLKSVLTHHEKLDGGGYPSKLTGEQYPEATQIIVQADQYCARLSPRSYRQPLLHKGILRDILLDQGKTVSQQIAALFVKEMGFYPPGLVVKLNNGEIGIVTKRVEKADTPVVHVCIKPRINVLEHPIKRNTVMDAYKIKEVLQTDDPEAEFDKLAVWGY